LIHPALQAYVAAKRIIVWTPDNVFGFEKVRFIRGWVGRNMHVGLLGLSV